MLLKFKNLKNVKKSEQNILLLAKLDHNVVLHFLQWKIHWCWNHAFSGRDCL